MEKNSLDCNIVTLIKDVEDVTQGHTRVINMYLQSTSAMIDFLNSR